MKRLDYICAGITVMLLLGRIGEAIQTFGAPLSVVDVVLAVVYVSFAAYLVFLTDDARWRMAGAILSGVFCVLYAFTAIDRILLFSRMDMAQAVKARIVIGMAVTSTVIGLIFLSYFVKRLLEYLPQQQRGR